jgi:hypothetical protein
MRCIAEIRFGGGEAFQYLHVLAINLGILMVEFIGKGFVLLLFEILEMNETILAGSDIAFSFLSYLLQFLLMGIMDSKQMV